MKGHKDMNQQKNQRNSTKELLQTKKIAIKEVMGCKTTSAHIHSSVQNKIRIQTKRCRFNKRKICANKNNEFIRRRKYANTI